jgi:putative CocE/NonD family hydrolase
MNCLANRLCCLLLPLAAAHLASQEPIDVPAAYAKTEQMVPMRDGVKLFTSVYAPVDTSQRWPIMLFRTPYGTGPYGPDNHKSSLGPSPLFTREKFIFVYQDVRGKNNSEGHFEVMMPVLPDKGPQEVDETTDTYDTIAWALEHIDNHNSRVGQWGISYPGWQTVMGMIDRHPALVASSPQASPSDMFIGDDFHHNGAFRLMYTFSWLRGNALVRSGPGERPQRFTYGTPDGYRFFMDVGPVRNINERYFQDRVPTWNDYMEHGTYDAYWQIRDFLPELVDIDHAVLNVAGWFDAEDFYGPMSIYYAIEKQNPVNNSTLVSGPWRHGGWARGPGSGLGDVQFGSNTSEYYRNEIEFPFFLYHLKGKGEANLPEAIVFETGSNQWKTYDSWPPRQTTLANLYLHPGGRLSFSPPGEHDSFESYLSDPAKPVPFSAETRTTQGHTWMIEDQRFAASRPDVLVFESEVLTEAVTIAGPILANLHVSTTGTDSDWVVKLIDVYPGDSPELSANPSGAPMGHFQMLLAGEVMRGKFRNSITDPEPMVPGEITPISFDLRDRYHTFLVGHRIMVQIHSTWFPVIDRNPQQFLDIFQAEEADFQKATQRVYLTPEHPSLLELRVLNR